jgi:type I restriction enzyme S subunit
MNPKIEPYKSMILVAPDHIESGTGRLLKKRNGGKPTSDQWQILVRKGRHRLQQDSP